MKRAHIVGFIMLCIASIPLISMHEAHNQASLDQEKNRQEIITLLTDINNALRKYRPTVVPIADDHTVLPPLNTEALTPSDLCRVVLYLQYQKIMTDHQTLSISFLRNIHFARMSHDQKDPQCSIDLLDKLREEQHTTIAKLLPTLPSHDLDNIKRRLQYQLRFINDLYKDTACRIAASYSSAFQSALNRICADQSSLFIAKQQAAIKALEDLALSHEDAGHDDFTSLLSYDDALLQDAKTSHALGKNAHKNKMKRKKAKAKRAAAQLLLAQSTTNIPAPSASSTQPAAAE